MLEDGGTAVDAAVAAAAVLCVVEPDATGVGGDAFALHWPPGARRPLGLDGAGPTGSAASVESLRAAGHAEMPRSGGWTITVPGAVDAWTTLLERGGRLGLRHVLEPAIGHAVDGFAVTPVIAGEWAAHAGRIEHDEAARATFLADGRAPRAGETFRNPELGRLLRAIAAGGPDAFYRGEPAERIGAAVEAAGGPLRASDLARWPGAVWVEPLSHTFRHVEVFELPPPGQGVVVLEALGIFGRLDGADRAEEEHHAIEALKLAFADASAHLADPLLERVPVDALLSDAHLDDRAARIGPRAAAIAGPGRASDTVYVAAVDGQGGACSLIQSLYSGFGSGVGVAGLGITLQNRGAGFVLDEGHPNRLAAGKRPFHTIIPAMLASQGDFLGCLGVVGDFMQPQGQMQILRHVLDHDLSLTEALAAPRARFLDHRAIGLEAGYGREIGEELQRRGHTIGDLDSSLAGGAQAILRDRDELRGASDPRKDGCALPSRLRSIPRPLR
ncbi:MAG: gamma-glutamyltransferase family protein [Solirubrobacteraceae bacterium MAG38_C4-C5]|nr:gamma-glutamyltransferase family protein [Candidatus Siliceabacter maunaloa]